MRFKLNSNLIFIIAILLFTVSINDIGHTETYYVSDMLVLKIRQGPGKEFNVLGTLKSNIPIEILEKGEVYYKMRTKNGVEGWVEKKYLSLNTPLNIVVKQLKQKIEELERTNKKLSTTQPLPIETNKNFITTIAIKWFLAGAGVFLLGWFIGRNIGVKKKSSNKFLN
ncbi:MAG: hypothetical protein B6I26_02485 [Desulfobacteraceae bacterium 4572_130]|nr:MAG: hypothetical protein B6I26_02485 [Desulfobacteraceae bacterium 4572_130]